MSETSPVDRLYNEAKGVITTLEDTNEISLQVAAADHFRKALLLAAASYFEHCICNHVLNFVSERSQKSLLIESFVRNKAIIRQYHTWFKWDEKNANHFFGLFGDEFKSAMNKRVRESEELRLAIRNFLEVENERNRLVHQDYATFQLEKTLDEIYSLYQSALVFVKFLPKALNDHDCLMETI